MTNATRIELIGVPDLPVVQPGEDLAALIAAGLERAKLPSRASISAEALAVLVRNLSPRPQPAAA